MQSELPIREKPHNCDEFFCMDDTFQSQRKNLQKAT